MHDVIPQAAATVTLVRDAACGFEVLLLQRNLQSRFMPGMFLFPGGGLDPEDAAAELCALCEGWDDERASAALGVEEGGLAYWAAAIRESFEEAGVLLAYDGSGSLVNLGAGVARERYREHRSALNAGQRTFLDVLQAEGLRLATDRLTYFSNWITPVGAPRRYDTRFFVALAPEAQEALHDNRETIHHVWISPAEALERHRRGEWKMRTPTVKTLEDFAAHASAASLIAALGQRHEIPAILPRINARGERVLPGDPDYDAAGTPEGAGRWKT